MNCCVKDCQSIKGGDVTFFNFPQRNSQTFNPWVEVCNRPDWSPTFLDSMICELHFHQNEMYSKSGKKFLKDLVIPKTTISPSERSNWIKSVSCRVCLNDNIDVGLRSMFTMEGEKTIAEQLQFATSIEVNNLIIP